MNIDRDSLADALDEMLAVYRDGENFRPVNPRLIYDSAEGGFAIESGLHEFYEHDHWISGQLDTNEGLAELFDGVDEDTTGEGLVAGWTNEWIAEYIVGDLDPETP